MSDGVRDLKMVLKCMKSVKKSNQIEPHPLWISYLSKGDRKLSFNPPSDLDEFSTSTLKLQVKVEPVERGQGETHLSTATANFTTQYDMVTTAFLSVTATYIAIPQHPVQY